MTYDRHRIATVGMFDGVHLGHQAVVRQVAALGSEAGLVPTIFSFTKHPLYTICPEKAPKMLTTPAQRARLLLTAGAESVVMLNFDVKMRSLTAEEFMRMLKVRYNVDVLVIGFNHHFGRDRKGSFADYKQIGSSLGIEVIQAQEYVLPGLDMAVSSSSIRQALSVGDINKANAMLGHPFALSGVVAHGRQIGHKIGFPTANIEPFRRWQLVPACGVYAAWLLLDGGLRPAMVNVGHNPTVSDGHAPLSVEAHVIDFDADIYGVPVELLFIERLRDEQRFESLAALSAQLSADRDQTIKILSNQQLMLS